MYQIAVVGGSRCSEPEKIAAREIGAEIARRGGLVICGGGAGVMEAAAAGARSAGGTVIGILPGSDHRDGNRHLSAAIATGLGEARNAVIAATADALIAVGGEYGTLSEIALGLKMGKPVVGLSSWSLSSPGEIKPDIIVADSPLLAVEKAFAMLK